MRDPPQRRGRPAQLTFLAALLALGAIYVARSLLIPATFGVLVALALAPVVRGLRRLWVPLPVAALLVLTALVAGFGYGALRLAEPARSWIRTAPGSLDRIERKLRTLKKPLEDVTEATRRMEDVAAVGPKQPPATTVTVQEPGFATLLATRLQSVTIGAVTALLFAYFLLATDNHLFRQVVQALPGVAGDGGAEALSRKLEGQLSRYLLTVTAVNALLGVAVGVVTYLMGLPNPALWGVMAMVFNYVPYAGGLVSTTVLTGVALLTFDDPWAAVQVPLVFVAMNSLEGMVITPVVLGRRLLLSPVAIIAGLMLWTWLWGVAGALLATPLLVMTAVIAEHVPPLEPLARMVRGE